MNQALTVHLGRQSLTEKKYLSFLEWVGQTNLFSAIKEGTKRHSVHYGEYDTAYVIKYDGNELRLNKGVVIDKPEDLPKEILIQFFLNSPFYITLEHEQGTQQPLLE